MCDPGVCWMPSCHQWIFSPMEQTRLSLKLKKYIKCIFVTIAPHQGFILYICSYWSALLVNVDTGLKSLFWIKGSQIQQIDMFFSWESTFSLLSKQTTLIIFQSKSLQNIRFDHLWLDITKKIIPLRYQNALRPPELEKGGCSFTYFRRHIVK